MDETRANFRNQEAAIRNLEIQVGQIAKQLNERPPNTFPSDTNPNPKEECKVIRVIEIEETPEVQVEVPTKELEIIAEIKNQEDVQHPPQSSKKHTSKHKTPERSGKTIENNSQHKESAEDFRPSPSQQKEEAVISPIPAEEEKKKKEPAAYMPKPPYPQRLKAENKNKAPKKEPKEEKGATNDSVKFQQIQKVPTMPNLPTTMGSNNKTYMITEGVCNKFFEPP
ncbi:hypothetical protein PIB30_096512 [Stylosanthes scabra]|uniref:Uncharacterized protein n=1 Tax=Stylosanthes scabra TaxID=79078 RepID=A0ABU6SYF9_9FABA|nr:hypothetical protein [Stylosanthes scabra]